MPPYSLDLLDRRAASFVLWLPGLKLEAPPQVILATYKDGNFKQTVKTPFVAVSGKTDLWELDPNTISPALAEGVYHYWFQVGDKVVTDPFAFTVDYTYADADRERSSDMQPPGVIKFRNKALWACDIDGKEPGLPAVPNNTLLPSNNHMVIYELPTSWTKVGTDDRGVGLDVGAFDDVRALFDVTAKGKHFSFLKLFGGKAHLNELGINALELLPVADTKFKAEWGYAPANYCAPDYDLGTSAELVALVDILHKKNIRLLTDVVMAFGYDSYVQTDFEQFHLNANDEPDNPDSYQSHTSGQKRDGFGGSLWRYLQTTKTYDPETGADGDVHPAWAFHKTHLTRWMHDFGVGGLRLDSLNNVGSWEFVKSYKQKAWDLYNARYGKDADPSKFLVIGEELSMPVSMVHDGCIDALWNETWQMRLRAVLLGEAYGEDNFEWTVRKVINCLQDNLQPGFSNGSQAVNYITSHDIEGYRKNRLFNFCHDSGITDVLPRAKLAFALLLTSVGIPMIFAGEEFADQQDQSNDMAKKQEDPVNYARKNDGSWRQDLFAYVSKLVRFRTKCPALGVDDTDVFHVDSSRGGKIIAWRRGVLGDKNAPPVVVVANFSDEATPGDHYDVPNWPEKEVSGWHDVSQDRAIPAEWVGREPLYAWEAKIYTCWKE